MVEDSAMPHRPDVLMKRPGLIVMAFRQYLAMSPSPRAVKRLRESGALPCLPVPSRHIGKAIPACVAARLGNRHGRKRLVSGCLLLIGRR
jgi:hypothetical protein